MEALTEYVSKHPFYVPFILLNLYIIYRVILHVLKEDFGEDPSDEDDNDPNLPDGPELDLPPGVSLPVDPELVEEY